MVGNEWSVATRVPQRLHREVKLHCIAAGVAMKTFIVEAITERLARERGPRRAPRVRPEALAEVVDGTADSAAPEA